MLLAAALLLLSPRANRAQDDGFNPALAPPAPLNEKVLTLARTITSSDTAILQFFPALNKDCSPRGVLSLTVREAPTHGSVRILANEQHLRFPAGTPYTNCNDMTVPGTALAYTPARGFIGEDSVGFEMSTTYGVNRAYQVKLTVK